MKNKLKWIGIALLAAVLIFGFTGCSEPEPSKSSAAKLDKILIGDADTDTLAGAEYFQMATAFSADAIVGSYNNMKDVVGLITLKDNGALTKPITLTVSKKAKARFVVTTASTGKVLTDFDDPTRNWGSKDSVPSGTIAENGTSHITVRVTAENKKTVKYYAFKVVVQGADAALATLSIGDVKASEGTGRLGSGEEDLSKVVSAKDTDNASFGYILLQPSQTSGKLLVSARGTADNLQTRKYATMPEATSGENQPPTSWNPLPAGGADLSNLSDGQRIYIEVTAENGKDKLYYVIELWQGREASLTSVTIQGRSIYEFATSAWNENIALITSPVIFQSADEQPDNGYTVAAAAVAEVPKDNVKWAVGKGTATLTELTFGTTSPIVFGINNDHLYVSVKSSNGKRTVYYKVKIVVQSSGVIRYGQPTITKGAHTVDPLFTDSTLERYNVSRVNVAEGDPKTQAPWFYNRQDGLGSMAGDLGHTTAAATARWDDDGLYVYVDVDFHDFYKVDGGVRTDIERKYVYPNGSAQHEGDNLEVYLNERKQRYTSGYYGIQYRIGMPSDTEIEISGDAGDGNDAQIEKFRASNKYDMWIKKDANGKQTGYAVVAYFPFGYIGDPDSDKIFKDGLVDAKADEGPLLGFELQLNVGGLTDGTRDCVLTWNGVGGQSYHNVFNYGSAELVMGDGVRGPLTTTEPRIVTQPKNTNFTNATVDAGKAELSVGAQGNGKLSYQWYSAASLEATTGTAVSGGTTNPLIITNKTVGTEQYYYVVVSNLRGTSGTPMTVQSRTVAVQVYEETGSVPVPIDLIFQTSTDTATYPDGINWKATLGDYDGVTAKLGDFPTDFEFAKYSVVEVEIVAYSDMDAKTPIDNRASLWTATLFQPWVGDSADGGYGAADFPEYTDRKGRLVNINSAAGTTVRATINATELANIAEAAPVGIRVERAGGSSAARALKIVSLKFLDPKYGSAPLPPLDVEPGELVLSVAKSNWKGKQTAAETLAGTEDAPKLVFNAAQGNNDNLQFYTYTIPGAEDIDFTQFSKIQFICKIIVDAPNSNKYELCWFVNDKAQTADTWTDLTTNSVPGPTSGSDPFYRVIAKRANQAAPETYTYDIDISVISDENKPKIGGFSIANQRNWSDCGGDFTFEVQYIRLLP